MSYIPISKQQAQELIAQHGSNWFSVKFVKRTNGELRKMICSTGVKKGLKGGVLKYNPSEKNLIPVYERSNGRRSINLDSILHLHIAKNKYIVSE